MATAGNGPSTGTDPPASSPGSFLHPSARPLGSSAAQPLCQWPASLPLYLCPAQGGFPGSAQGCKSAPQARQSRKMSPCQVQELGLVPDTQPSHGGQGCRSTGTRTRDPWHSGLWPAWGPLPSTHSPAGYNLLLHIPAVLSRCAGTATPSLVAPSQAEPSGAALRTAPETRQHNPMPQTQSECGDLSSGHCPVWPQLLSLLEWAVQPGSHDTPGHLLPGEAGPEAHGYDPFTGSPSPILLALDQQGTSTTSTTHLDQPCGVGASSARISCHASSP